MSVPPEEEDALVSQTGMGGATCPGRQEGNTSQRYTLRNQGCFLGPGEIPEDLLMTILGEKQEGWAACVGEQSFLESQEDSKQALFDYWCVNLLKFQTRFHFCT